MNIIPEITSKIKTRFFRYVSKGTEDSCWEWSGAMDKDGYGFFWVAGKLYRSHRVSWVIHQSPIHASLLVLHRCDNPRCVNPDHLFLGTDADNADDRERKGRGNKATGTRNGAYTHPEKVPRGDRSGARLHPEKMPRWELHGRSVLTWSQVREIRVKYIPWKYNTIQLAKEYNVSKGAIWLIVNNKTWIE